MTTKYDTIGGIRVLEVILSYLKDFQSKPLDENFNGEVADAFNQVIAYLEEFENDE